MGSPVHGFGRGFHTMWTFYHYGFDLVERFFVFGHGLQTICNFHPRGFTLVAFSSTSGWNLFEVFEHGFQTIWNFYPHGLAFLYLSFKSGRVFGHEFKPLGDCIHMVSLCGFVFIVWIE